MFIFGAKPTRNIVSLLPKFEESGCASSESVLKRFPFQDYSISRITLREQNLEPPSVDKSFKGVEWCQEIYPRNTQVVFVGENFTED